MGEYSCTQSGSLIPLPAALSGSNSKAPGVAGGYLPEISSVHVFAQPGRIPYHSLDTRVQPFTPIPVSQKESLVSARELAQILKTVNLTDPLRDIVSLT